MENDLDKLRYLLVSQRQWLTHRIEIEPENREWFTAMDRGICIALGYIADILEEKKNERSNQG